MGQNKQLEQVREHLITHRTITPIQALEQYGCYRLAARICDLRKEGLQIVTSVKNKSKVERYAKYTLRGKK